MPTQLTNVPLVVGSGLWMPEARPLGLLRRNIDRKPELIRRVLTDAALRKKIFGGIPNDEKKVIKAFAAQNAENALKTKPKMCLDLLLLSAMLSFRVIFCVPCFFCRVRWGLASAVCRRVPALLEGYFSPFLARPHTARELQVSGVKARPPYLHKLRIRGPDSNAAQAVA